MERARVDGRRIALAIVDGRDDTAVLGSCDLRRPLADDPALGEIGYLLDTSARGRGVATRAIGLLVTWAFDALGFERVQALVVPGNQRSLALLDRLGFERDGLLRGYRPASGGANGPRQDAVMLGRLSPRASRG